MMDSRLLRKTGFTLTEMLLTAALLSVIGANLLAVLFNGTMLWEKITSKVVAEDVDIFLERISSDLRSTFLFETIPFLGKSDSISFPVVISAVGQSQGVGRTDYIFNRINKTIEKRLLDFKGIYGDHILSRRILLRHVDTLQLSYYYHDPKSDDYGWQSAWPDNDVSFDDDGNPVLPLAVRIKIGVQENGVPRYFTRTVSIPAGCCRLLPEE